MKKIILSLLAAFVAISVYGQKNIDLDNYRFNFTYRELPKKPLNPAFFYYGTQINLASSVQQVVDINSLYDKLKIEGQRHSEDLQADDILVTLNIEPVIIENAEIKERVVESKNKEGKVTSRDYYYSAVVTYTFDAKASVTQGGQKIANYNLYSRANKLTHKSAEYSSSKEASEHWKNNRENIRDKYVSELSQHTASSLSTMLSTDFGYRTLKTSDLFKITDEKKHPENENFRAACEKLKSKVESFDGTIAIDVVDIEDLIEYFKNIIVKYPDPKSKADKKLRYAAYFNLSKIYLYWEKPENVQEWADLLFINDHDKGDAKKLIQEAEKIRKLLDSSDIKTRHFNPEDYFKD